MCFFRGKMLPIFILGMIAALKISGFQNINKIYASQVYAPVERNVGRSPGMRLMIGTFTLTEAQEYRPFAESSPSGESRPLSEQSIRNRLSRLEPLCQDDYASEFAIRPATSPPLPYSDVTVKSEFPSQKDAPLPPADQLFMDTDEVLSVIRVVPEGEAEIVPSISVTFSRPMVEIFSHKEAAEVIPVKVQPQQEGVWRWMGTQTLIFEPETTLQQATEYQIVVCEDAVSADGKKISGNRIFNFSTPPMKLQNRFPVSNGVSTKTPILLVFDQKIDPQSVAEMVRVDVGGRSVGFKVEDPHNLPAQVPNRQREENRRLLLSLTEELPRLQEVTVTVLQGAPSLEGSLTTQEDYTFSFITHGPFTLSKVSCRRGYCSPVVDWSFRGSNPINVSKFDLSMISVQPEVEDLSVNVNLQRDQISVRGRFIAGENYTVLFSEDIEDVFGQKLSGGKRFTINTNHYMPQFHAEYDAFTIADPTASPRIRLNTVNYTELEMKVWRVSPEHYSSYTNLHSSIWNHYFRGAFFDSLPGNLVESRRIPIDYTLNEWTETILNLDEYLPNGKGNIIVWVTPTENAEGITCRFSTRSILPPHILTWYQVTDIGLDIWRDPEHIYVLATTLEDGKPNQGVKIEYGGRTKLTDGKGTALIDSLSSDFLIIATKDKDSAFLPLRHNHYKRDYRGLFHVFDDRHIYRPDEEVSIKGWVRKIERRVGADVELILTSEPLRYTVRDARGAQITDGTTGISSLGGFDFTFKIPSTPALGRANVSIVVDTFKYNHTFQIQEFRTPEFESVTSICQGPHFAGDEFVSTVKATYYAGGGVSEAKVNWRISALGVSYTPPNQQSYFFGKQQSSWFWRSPQFETAWNSEHFQGTTDLFGSHSVNVSFDRFTSSGPFALNAVASVTDLNNQNQTSSARTLIHPATYYVGLKTDQNHFEPGNEVAVEWVVTDVDGNLVSDVPVRLRAQRVETSERTNPSSQDTTMVYEREVNSQSEASVWKFTPQQGGNWKITAELEDKQGRKNQSSIFRWVHTTEIQPAESVELQNVMIFPDKDSYSDGDTAKLLLQVPFAPSEGVVLLQRYGMVEKRRIKLNETTKTLRIPIKEEYVPNLNVEVHFAGVTNRKDEQSGAALAIQPALANGRINLSVPPTKRTLLIEATPQKTHLAPGESTRLNVRVRDSDNSPVRGAEVAVVVVDEAVLALSRYTMRDPLEVFYSVRPASTSSIHNRPYVVLENLNNALPEKTIDESVGPRSRSAISSPSESMASRTSGEEGATTIRSDFNPLAVFHPAGLTDRRGRLTVDFQLPDNLTRYRVMVVAVEGAKRFGSAESNMTARLPLMVRPSPPRFLNYGDSFELPVILQNQTDEFMDVDVVARASNLDLKSKGYSVRVPANSRVEVRFPASTISSGTARLQVAGFTSGYSDAVNLEIPVWTPVATEAFATYGTVDSGAVSHIVKRPQDVLSQFGGVQISTSSTALKELIDAYIYLFNNDFNSSEHIASSIIPVVAFGDVIHAFNIPAIPSKEQIKWDVASRINLLSNRQNRDGGFSFWGRESSCPFTSCHVTHSLVRAHLNGYDVNDRVLSSSLLYMRNIESHLNMVFSETARRTIIAYSLYVRALYGDYDEARAKQLISQTSMEEWSTEALGWILYTLSNSPDAQETLNILRSLNNRVHETASDAHFIQNSSYDDSYLVFQSDYRGDAVVLEALMKVSPDNDLIVKLVRGLLGNRRAGRWSNSQVNGFVLLALCEYFNRYETQDPDFIGRAWLGSQYAGDHQFRKRTTETHLIDIPMHYLGERDSVQNLILQKDGSGRMYYRIAMNYAPQSHTLEPASHGFKVERKYEGVDDTSDVKLLEDGTYKIRAGARVKITVKMYSPVRRYHVALVDPLPAGLEALNSNLEGAQKAPCYKHFGRSWRWYRHQNLRDERAEAFTPKLWGGVYEYIYFARATTPGEFVVPPAKASEMYSPETFGRSGTDRVIVR
ncbi:Uncharacterized protein CHISP_3365 [Chitinispirillum alkaliphilum]|nr:Uncharacterized protein CHISP_3365 [Chitinispirillum alkaliphilum]